MSEQNCAACGGCGYTTHGSLNEHGSWLGTAPCYLCNSPKQRLLTGDEESALSKALKRSTKEIKRPITKADAEAYCRDNGMIMVPEEPTKEMVMAGDNLKNMHKLRSAWVRNIYSSMVEAYRIQGF